MARISTLLRRWRVALFVRLRRLSRRRSGRAICAALLTLVVLTALRAYDPRLIVEMKERTFDTYQRLQPRSFDPNSPVRIIDIDEASIAAFGQWPWPRTRLAELTNRLNELGAGAIAYDTLFAEPDRTSPARIAPQFERLEPDERDRATALLARLPDHDRIFADAIARAPVVLGFATGGRGVSGEAGGRHPQLKAGISFAGVDPVSVLPAFSGAVTSLKMFDDAASGIGSINLSAHDRSGIVRRAPMLLSDGERVYPGLGVETLRVAQRASGLLVRSTGASGEGDVGRAALIDMRVGQFTIPLTAQGETWVYFDRDRPERYISVKDLLDPAKADAMRSKIEGTLVLVGSSALGLLDMRTTPLGEVVPGVSIHAQLLEQVLAGDFISRPDWADGFEILLTIVLGLLLTALLLLFGVRFSFIGGVIALGIAIWGSWLAFSHARLLIDPIYPALAAIAVYIAVERALHVTTDREKKFVRQAFGQYLAPELLVQLESSPQALKLGGEQRELTVMFVDVRGFTTLAEHLSAHELVEFINALLSPLSDVIQSERGTIDKYIGDSIMAFWNAPLDTPAHAAHACRAALKMRALIAELNAVDAFGLAARGVPDPQVKIGIGINTGLAIVGNMGSARRFNYSAMGDVVNVAARIESATKDYGVDILVSAETASQAEGFDVRALGEVPLKGKTTLTRLFSVQGEHEGPK